MFGKRGSALEAVVEAPIDPDPTAHGRPWAMERASHPCVRLLGAGERHANELPLRLPRRLQPILLAFPAVGRSQPRARVEGCAEVPRKWAAHCPFTPPHSSISAPCGHAISHLQLLLSLCWPVFRPACCLLAAALRGETLPLKPLHCPAPSLPPSLPSRQALPCSALLTASGCSLALTRV